MAVIRNRITVFPPDGETVTVDILDDSVSLGTVHAERATTRTLTLPLTITAATSFYVPAGTGPYDVSVKLDGEEIASSDNTPVTVSSFPAEIRTRIDAAELGSLAGPGVSVPVAQFLWNGYLERYHYIESQRVDGGETKFTCPVVPLAAGTGIDLAISVDGAADVDYTGYAFVVKYADAAGVPLNPPTEQFVEFHRNTADGLVVDSSEAGDVTASYSGGASFSFEASATGWFSISGAATFA